MSRLVVVCNLVRIFKKVAPESAGVYRTELLVDTNETVEIGEPVSLYFDHRLKEFVPARWPDENGSEFYLLVEELERASVQVEVSS